MRPTKFAALLFSCGHKLWNVPWTKDIITLEEMVAVHLPSGLYCFSFCTLICLPSIRKFTFRTATGISSYQGILFKKACNFLIFREAEPFKDMMR